MKLDNLNDLFVLEVQGLYEDEKQITQATPQIAEQMVNFQALKPSSKAM